MFATPVAYFAAHERVAAARSRSRAANPPEYNGLKMVLAGTTLAGETIQRLRRRIESGDLARGAGRHRRAEIREAYLARIASDVKLARPMKIAVDCGNGVAGATAGELYRRLGCEVFELYCDVDGRFPNHHPDPSHPENLKDLIALVRKDTPRSGSRSTATATGSAS
jgi:phosphomannomutase/phosphoglucomutase